MSAFNTVMNPEHRFAYEQIVRFVEIYRFVNGLTQYRASEPDVKDRDGTIHEMIFDNLVVMKVGIGSDWHLVLSDRTVATEVLRHIEEEDYDNKQVILAQWLAA